MSSGLVGLGVLRPHGFVTQPPQACPSGPDICQRPVGIAHWRPRELPTRDHQAYRLQLNATTPAPEGAWLNRIDSLFPDSATPLLDLDFEERNHPTRFDQALAAVFILVVADAFCSLNDNWMGKFAHRMQFAELAVDEAPLSCRRRPAWSQVGLEQAQGWTRSSTVAHDPIVAVASDTVSEVSQEFGNLVDGILSGLFPFGELFC